MSAFAGVYSGRRVLVTGHTGFKGSWLCRWLMELGAEVAGFSLDIPTDPSHFKLLKLEKRIWHRFGDIRDQAALDRCFKEFHPELVFHLAAQPLVRASYDDPVGTFEVNALGTARVLEAARHAPSVRALVNVSSDKCYENFERSVGYKETDHLGGKDPYSASKGAAEIVFGAYSRSFFADVKNVAVGSVRAGNVIGGGDWAQDRILPDCVRAWSRREKVRVRSPRSIRPWQHVLEPISGYLAFGAALWHGRLRGEALNIGPAADSNHTVETLIGEIQKTWVSVEWVHDPSGTGSKKEAGILMLDCEKAHRLLNWSPTLTFAEGVAMTGAWYRDHYAGSAADELTLAQIRAYERLALERGLNWVK